MKDSRIDPRAAAFVDYLRRYREDRGARAALRGGLSEARRPSAWPMLGGFPGALGHRAFETVAALWASDPELNREGGNLGDTLAELSAGHASFEGRFKRLLSCGRDEIPSRVAPVVRAAQARRVPIDHARLLSDLLRWNNTVRTEWAKSFWRAEEAETIDAALLDKDEP